MLRYHDNKTYHLVDMNTSIILVESQVILNRITVQHYLTFDQYDGSQVILNRITGFKSKNIKCAVQGENAQGALRIMRLASVCIKAARANLSSNE